MIADKIRHLHRSEIDLQKWDKLVEHSIQRHVYATSWWLDAVTSEDWSALVLGDYEAVFPLCIKKKWYLFSYFYRPILTQQLGLFTSLVIDDDLYAAMLSKLNKTLSRYDFTIHGHNIDIGHMTQMENQVIALHQNVDLRKNYNRLTRRNLDKARQLYLHSYISLSIDEGLAFCVQHSPIKLSSDDAAKLKTIFTKAAAKDICDVWKTVIEKQIVAVGICIRYYGRVYFLLTANHTDFKDTYGGFYMIDSMIHYYQQKGENLFDFTGSIIPDIARRNMGYGAEREIYYRVKQ
jgi:hypothetical protein